MNCELGDFMSNEEPHKNLLSVYHFCQKHPSFSEAALRRFIFKKNENGFNEVVKKIEERKVLLDEEAFFKWVDDQQKKKKEKSRDPVRWNF